MKHYKETKISKLVCIATGTLPIIINWFKVGGEIPSGAEKSNSTINSTVS